MRDLVRGRIPTRIGQESRREGAAPQGNAARASELEQHRSSRVRVGRRAGPGEQRRRKRLASRKSVSVRGNGGDEVNFRGAQIAARILHREQTLGPDGARRPVRRQILEHDDRVNRRAEVQLDLGQSPSPAHSVELGKGQRLIPIGQRRRDGRGRGVRPIDKVRQRGRHGHSH